MSSLPEQTTAENAGEISRPIQQAARRARIFYVDHLRVALTILVVLHHLAVIYGASATFYYVESPYPKDMVAFLSLLIFVLFNQAYFMGFFFLISGYFTPGSFDRKGARSFYKDRLLRLGIPLLVYVFVLSPIAMISPRLTLTPTGALTLVPPHTWQEFPTTFGVGPLWFAEMLLFFCLGYGIWRWLIRGMIQRHERILPLPNYRTIGLFILVQALASYLLRIAVPMDFQVPILGFPTFSYFPQYLSFFIIGIIAYRYNWFEAIPDSMGKIGFIAAGVATIVLFPLALSGGTVFVGHGTMQSAIYALWDSIFSVGMCLGLLTLFRRFFNRQNRTGRFLSQQAFTVYIIHIPVIVLLALALRGVHLESLLKFALAAVIGVPLSIALAFLIRKIPLASKIL